MLETLLAQRKLIKAQIEELEVTCQDAIDQDVTLPFEREVWLKILTCTTVLLTFFDQGNYVGRIECAKKAEEVKK